MHSLLVPPTTRASYGREAEAELSLLAVPLASRCHDFYRDLLPAVARYANRRGVIAQAHSRQREYLKEDVEQLDTRAHACLEWMA